MKTLSESFDQFGIPFHESVDDWRSEGIKFETEKDSGVLFIRALKDGKEIGVMDVAPSAAEPGKLYPLGVKVDPAFRRKGVATEMYRIAEKHFGLPFTKGHYQSPEGKAFRKAYSKLKKEEYGPVNESKSSTEIRVVHEPTSSGQDLVIGAFDGSRQVGMLRVYDLGRGKITASDVEVDSEYRRKGIATAMYVFAEKHTGSKMIPADQAAGPGFDPEDTFSDDAKAFWNQSNRPFGEADESGLVDGAQVANLEDVPRGKESEKHRSAGDKKVYSNQEVAKRWCEMEHDSGTSISYEKLLSKHSKDGWRLVDLPIESVEEHYEGHQDSEGNIQGFIKLAQGGSEFPPIIVKPYPGRPGIYKTIDGFHRLLAARRLGQKKIKAYVPAGSVTEDFDYEFTNWIGKKDEKYNASVKGSFNMLRKGKGWIPESVIKLENPDGLDVAVLRNPNLNQVLNALDRSSDGVLKYCQADGQMYVWDAFHFTHDGFCDQMGIDPKKADLGIIESAEDAEGIFAPQTHVAESSGSGLWSVQQVWDAEDWRDSYYDLFPGYSKPEEQGQDYVYDTRAKATAAAKELIDIFEGLGDPVHLYRVVHAESQEQIDMEMLGEHWSWDRKTALEFAGYNLQKPWFMIEAKIKRSEIDWGSTLRAQMAHPYEREIFIPYPARPSVSTIQRVDKKS